jgi:hypothetical protein
VIQPSSPFLFQTTDSEGDELDQIVSGEGAYLVKIGTPVEGINSWWSIPAGTFGVGVEWKGMSDEANIALRMDAV